MRQREGNRERHAGLNTGMYMALNENINKFYISFKAVIMKHNESD